MIEAVHFLRSFDAVHRRWALDAHKLSHGSRRLFDSDSSVSGPEIVEPTCVFSPHLLASIVLLSYTALTARGPLYRGLLYAANCAGPAPTPAVATTTSSPSSQLRPAMSAAAVQAGQAPHSPYSATASYLEQNAESYYNNVVATGGASLNPRSDLAQKAYALQAQLSSPDQAGLSGHAQRDRVRDRPVVDAQYDGSPPVPTRTSSQVQAASASSPAAGSDQRGASSRRARQQPYSPEDERARSREDAAASAARSRRKQRSTPEEGHRSPGTREVASTQPNGAVEPAPLVRENSEVINRVVVSDPRVDAERVKERVAEAQPVPLNDLDAPEPAHQPPVAGTARRQDYSKSSSSKRRDVQFGDYILGQTLGEGEFGKVKLGWKRDGSTQVAIKLIRRDSVQNHPGRLPKIYREISILQDLAHPNIVRLHEMVETERHIGIILEYASGGELFDYILNHRYLKDPAARRLFAQLVSGVGYLHKKGIVHRDLKLENLLLDQNRNIIITDFGFANTFNPADTLSDEIEYNLSNKDFVRKFKLDRLDAQGMRRGDLMQTSCGSPCYAAPELVVSDSLYTGRKVDVWSCGVILYAMLAGYLPFDDDPANPEGDNINLLYKYITTTPLTFPEYVSPHARDLLRRILVPDPRKRADLFEVARHSWLSEYQHVVSHVTSSTTNIADISNSTLTVATEPPSESSTINRSASVREPSKTTPHQAPKTAIPRAPEGVQDIDQLSAGSRRDKGTRHTLQTEYVAPKSHTTRGAAPVTATAAAPPPAATAYAATSESQQRTFAHGSAPTSSQKQLPSLPAHAQAPEQSYRASSQQQKMPPPTRPVRDAPRSASDIAGTYGSQPNHHGARPNTQGSLAPGGGPTQQNPYGGRPSTQGSLASAGGPTRSDPRLPSRGSYGQPVAPTVAATNAEGRVTQPSRPARGFNMPSAGQHRQQASIGQPTTQPMPPNSYHPGEKTPHHRRSSTLSGLGEKLFGRSSSLRKKDEERQKNGRKYPPTSMKPYQIDGEAPPRLSTESKRSFSFGLGKKRSTDLESQNEKAPNRRFSLLPSSWSFKSNKDYAPEPTTPQMVEYSQPSAPATTSAPVAAQPVAAQPDAASYNEPRPSTFSRPPPQPQNGQFQQKVVSQHNYDNYNGGSTTTTYLPPTQPRSHHIRGASQPLASLLPQHRDAVVDQGRASMQQSRPPRTVLTKQPRKYVDGYDYEADQRHYSGGSSAVRKVQDFFRRKGRARADSNYS
ncbi:hypothetical protein DV735_g2872, partial [Chaetothyriales sp. CBS 134920]